MSAPDLLAAGNKFQKNLPRIRFRSGLVSRRTGKITLHAAAREAISVQLGLREALDWAIGGRSNGFEPQRGPEGHRRKLIWEIPDWLVSCNGRSQDEKGGISRNKYGVPPIPKERR